MNNRIASAYDRNPARLALLVRTNRRTPNREGKAAIGVMISIALVVLVAWGYLSA